MTTPEPRRDPIPSYAHDVIALYTEALADVRFPDLDLATLQEHAEELKALQRELERIEDELDVARSKVAAEADLLLTRAQRALAYARVFAEGNDELTARIARIGQGRHAAANGEASAPKKRGRQRKGEGDTSLFGALGEASEGGEETRAAPLAEHAA